MIYRLILTLFFVNLLFSCNIGKDVRNNNDNASVNENIRLNQIGYYPESVKKFVIVDSNAERFNIVDAESNDIVYSGVLKNKGIWKASNERVKTGSFSDLKKQGTYRIQIDNEGFSYDFEINDNLYSIVLKAAVKSFYYQRSGMDLKKKYAGKWYRKKGHPDTNCILHKSTGKTGRIDSPGGWYDAGDYGKYIVNGGISVCTLLSCCELFPGITGDSINIPESNNNIDDLLDEIKYELDWFITMQDDDGGVFFKLGPLKWPGFIMPEKDNTIRYIIGKSTTSALNFSAALAQAGRVYYKVDESFSAGCIDKAERAWEWAVKNPSVEHPDETGGTGPYNDNDYSDEFIWAAAELYITTGKDIYKKYLEANIVNKNLTHAAWWGSVENLAYFSILTSDNNLDNKIKETVRSNILNYSDKIMNQIDNNPYDVPVINADFVWGSNSFAGNYAVTLIYAYLITNDDKYIPGIVSSIDYIFGRNAAGYSFVTGYGSKSPMHPHHRPSGADSVKEPVPGFIVGGPNNDKQDRNHGVSYKNNYPAKSYKDVQASYASNEIAINWNAPLVFTLAFMEYYY